MARPKGTKYIETPEKMWELFLEYKAEIKANPIKVTDWVGGIAKQVEREKERPLTFVGFENYVDNIGAIGGLDQYFTNKDGKYDDYSDICMRIKRNIQQDQIEGGMACIYNPSITQRLNGLTEKVEQENKGEIKHDVIVTLNL
jgi:DNA-packaging protein gp3